MVKTFVWQPQTFFAPRRVFARFQTKTMPSTEPTSTGMDYMSSIEDLSLLMRQHSNGCTEGGCSNLLFTFWNVFKGLCDHKIDGILGEHHRGRGSAKQPWIGPG